MTVDDFAVVVVFGAVGLLVAAAGLIALLG